MKQFHKFLDEDDISSNELESLSSHNKPVAEKPLLVFWMAMCLMGFGALILSPFMEEVDLLDATCFFVIAACVEAHINQSENMNVENIRHVIYRKKLREIRDSVNSIKNRIEK